MFMADRREVWFAVGGARVMCNETRGTMIMMLLTPKLWVGCSNCNVILSFRKPVKTFTIYLISEGKNTFDVDWNKKKKKSLLITHSDSDLRLMLSMFLAGCNYRSPLDTCRILAQLCNNVFTSLSASEGTARGAVLQITHQSLPVTINI